MTRPLPFRMTAAECIEALTDAGCVLVPRTYGHQWERRGVWFGGFDPDRPTKWCRDWLEFHRDILATVWMFDGRWDGDWEPNQAYLTVEEWTRMSDEAAECAVKLHSLGLEFEGWDESGIGEWRMKWYHPVRGLVFYSRLNEKGFNRRVLTMVEERTGVGRTWLREWDE